MKNEIELKDLYNIYSKIRYIHFKFKNHYVNDSYNDFIYFELKNVFSAMSIGPKRNMWQHKSTYF